MASVLSVWSTSKLKLLWSSLNVTKWFYNRYNPTALRE